MAETETKTGVLLGNVAARLREELGVLYLVGRNPAPSDERASAYFEQSRLRVTRLARNMETDAALMRGEAFERENEDIVRLISDICEGAADLAEYLKLSLTFQCAEEAHICAVHAEYMRQLAYHLASNAMKNASPGGHVRVSLRFPKAERRILLSVSDDGAGIAADRLPSIFDDFRRDGRGGLGLPICKRIAEGHGGFIAVKSKLGKGSEFTLSIPDEAKKTVKFRRPDFHVPDGGIHPALLWLSDALPPEAFQIGEQP